MRNCPRVLMISLRAGFLPLSASSASRDVRKTATRYWIRSGSEKAGP
jgi:hypothetical protein